MIKVLFICHGNICRSPMAEFVMKYLVHQKGRDNEFEIASCATSREEIGNDMHYGSKTKLLQVGIPYKPRKARQLTAADYDNYDLLIAMDDENLRYIRNICGEDTAGKVHLLLEWGSGVIRSIADPWYTGNFDDTYDDILCGCTGLLDALPPS